MMFSFPHLARLLRPYAIACAVVWGALVSAVLHAQPAALVTTDAVIREAFTQTVPVVGTLVAKQAGVVAARVGEAVAEIQVEVGEEVVRGQGLAMLDTEALELQRTVAEARNAAANAELALAAKEVERMSGMTSSATISQADYDNALQRHDVARARMQEATAAAEAARLELANAQIRAPYDGVVTARLTEVGSYVARGEGVVRMLSHGALELETDIPHDYVNGLAPGVRVEVVMDGEVGEAVVRAVIPEENARTATRRVRFALAPQEAAAAPNEAAAAAPAGDSDITLDPAPDNASDRDEPAAPRPRAATPAAGQSVTVRIPAGVRRQILSVHKDAIIRRGADSFVFVVAEGVADMRPIRTGASSGVRLEVLEGLTRGDQVVIRGNERLMPGQAVTVANPQ